MAHPIRAYWTDVVPGRDLLLEFGKCMFPPGPFLGVHSPCSSGPSFSSTANTQQGHENDMKWTGEGIFLDDMMRSDLFERPLPVLVGEDDLIHSQVALKPLFRVSDIERPWFSKFSVSEKDLSWTFNDHPVPFSHSRTCSAFLQNKIGVKDEDEDDYVERKSDVDQISDRTTPAQERAAAKIGSVLLLEQNGKILMTRRSGGLGLFPEVWVFPGGHVEPGESLREAASREFEEEVGLHIEPSALDVLCLWESCFPISWKEPLQAHHLVAFFFARNVLKTGVAMPRLQLDECDAYSWVSTDSALSIVLDRQYGSPERILGARHLPQDLESGASSRRSTGIPEILDAKQEWKRIGDNLAMGHRFAMHVWLAQQKKDS